MDKCGATWIPGTVEIAPPCQQIPEYLIVRFMELYQDGELVSPDHDIYDDALRWFCGPHAMDWIAEESDCTVISLVDN